MALDDQMRHMVNFYLILKFAIDYQNHAWKWEQLKNSMGKKWKIP